MGNLMIKTKDIRLVSSPQDLRNRIVGDSLFETTDGDLVFEGDLVSFYKEGDYMPYSGPISNISGLKIALYDNVFDVWEYEEVARNE